MPQICLVLIIPFKFIMNVLLSGLPNINVIPSTILKFPESFIVFGVSDQYLENPGTESPEVLHDELSCQIAGLDGIWSCPVHFLIWHNFYPSPLGPKTAVTISTLTDSKVHWANMGPIWGWQDRWPIVKFSIKILCGVLGDCLCCYVSIEKYFALASTNFAQLA